MTDSEGKIKIVTWNVNELRVRRRRQTFFEYLKLLKCDVIILQETHLLKSERPKIIKYEKWVDKYVCTNQTCCIKGVAIIVKKPSKIIIVEEYVDSKGRWAAAKIKLEEKYLFVVGYYGPNTDDPAPLQSLYTQLISISIPIILGRDFNLLLDPINDRHPPGRALNLPKMRKWMNRLKEDLGLVDIWKSKGDRNNRFTY